MTRHIATTGGTVSTPIPAGELLDRHLIRLCHATAGAPGPSAMELSAAGRHRAVSA